MNKSHHQIWQIVGIMLLASSVIITASCKHESLLVHFGKGDYYMGTVENRDLVIQIDEISDNAMQCKLYSAESAIVDPQNIVVKVKGKKKWVVEGEVPKEPLKINPSFIGKNVRCQMKQLKEEAWFSPIVADTVQFESQYLSPRFEVRVDKDVKYAEAMGYWTSYPDEDRPFAKIYFDRIGQLVSKKDLDLTMDVYQPVSESDELRPLIMFIHGGSFINGDKADEAYCLWCSHFASLGYVAVSINYRMGWSPSSTNIDAAGFRATQDAHAALRFLVHNANRYHINTDWIFVGGSSAGAITALNVAFLNDKNKPASVTHEGPVAKLAPEYPESFHISSVVNMWGAVCDTAILKGSNTSIISFHGDADDIIPYKCGYPFVSLLEKKKEEQSDGFWGSLLSLVVPNSDAEFWGRLVSPMYGSYCIDKYCKEHGKRSELHTVAGAGHSMHVDEHRHIAPYFYTIQNSTSHFLYEDMVKCPVNFEREGALNYRIDASKVSEVHWQAIGGIAFDCVDNHARMIFFGDEPYHKAVVSGKYKSGVEFKEEITVN